LKSTHTLIIRKSNIRLIDCINKPKALIDYAINQGLKGISITDHECLSAAMEVNMYAKELQEKYPDFKIALGNEIYLVDERKPGIKYYHCILIAKDAIGHKQLRELSSIAWMNSYSDRGLERVPTLKSDLKRIIKADPGHVIATSACIGGELSANTLIMAQARLKQDKETAQTAYNNIVTFMKYMIEIFKDDFYIECAPGISEEQILVNKNLVNIARVFNKKMVIGTDAHYLSKDQRFVHKNYLNSKEGEREVDDFYEFSYLQTEEELREHLSISGLDYDKLCNNSMEIYDKITFYSLQKHQSIPEVEVKDYPKKDIKKEYKVLNSLYQSDNKQERYWVNQCEEALIQKGLNEDKRYWDRLEEEASVKRTIGEKLQTCMFAYPNTLQHYIDLFWRCGSTVGAGRGSACSGLNHYLLGITQLDPIKWDLPFWRYLNNERVELGDIDLDLAPSKLQEIFKEIRKERGEYGLVQVATFGTEGTKSAIQTACRGYRSEIYPDGIDVDEAQYLSSLIPNERGFLWPIKDVVFGNEELDRKPITQFINEVNKYPGLLDIMQGIEGIISRRGSHASGVILFDKDIYESAALMKTPSGAIITQWDLHMQEAAGSVKYDFLLTSVQDIIIQTIKLLQNDGVWDKNLSIREIYNKYLHPEVLPLDDKKIWNALAKGSVINCFQFDSAVGSQAAKKIKPKNPTEMADANGSNIGPYTLYLLSEGFAVFQKKSKKYFKIGKTQANGEALTSKVEGNPVGN
jgi:DNA polymerase III subunit alpha